MAGLFGNGSGGNIGAIGAIGSIGLAGAEAAGNYFMTDAANRNNERLMKQQMDFQAYMSNSAHQREVQDLIAAGLNPTLSAGGNGSSTPSGASATFQAPNIKMPDILPALSLIQNQQRLDIESRKADAEIAKRGADTGLIKAKTIKEGKGMIKAELEGEAAQVMRKMLREIKQFWSNPPQPGKNFKQPPGHLYQDDMP